MYRYISDISNRKISVDISEVHKSSEVKWKLNLGSIPIAINEKNI